PLLDRSRPRPRAQPTEPIHRDPPMRTPQGWLGLQRTVGNQAVAQLQRTAFVQRSPLSDDLAARSAGKKPSEAFALVREPKFKTAAADAAELAAMTTVLKTALADPSDQWVALRILAGRLGMSQGLTKKETGLAKDIPAQPIEVSFVPGRSDDRALVIAGVHGSERQGTDGARALPDIAQKGPPHYSVIVGPSP